jgi:excinuclease ABC subunit C
MSDFDAAAMLAQCSREPGVYRMLDERGEVLYVGKARDLRARLSSYFQSRSHGAKTRALVARIADVQTTVTASEAEALLLEQSLIKELRPPYNILLRDDKSYPYIKLTTADRFPRIAFHRGARRGKARYFGPYPGAGAVRETLGLIERVFRLRNCSDSYFRNRTRPCLQHQIGRCTAPCVGLVSEQAYAEQVRLAMEFLQGRDQAVTRELEQRMEDAAGALDFETAAALRDQIAAIRSVQQRQYVDTGRGNVDVVVCRFRHGMAVVEVLFIRGGRMLGHHTHVPRSRGDLSEQAVLEAFLPQYYLDGSDRSPPREVVLDRDVPGTGALQEALASQHGRRVRIASRVRGERARWVEMAVRNADESLARELAARESLEGRFAALNRLLSIEGEGIGRIECFDISHTGGEKAVASCVVFNQEGAVKSDYRRFNVEPSEAGDDYAAMEEAVSRRYRRLTREGARLPDLLLIDGGKGQVARAAAVLQQLDLASRIELLGISKGPSRKAGLEILHRGDGSRISPAADDPALHLLQQVRDEAHRFAITGHRQRRGKARKGSTLEEIPGVGAGRRKALLTHFGGLAQLRNASVEAIAAVPGISRSKAEDIYAWLHG